MAYLKHHTLLRSIGFGLVVSLLVGGGVAVSGWFAPAPPVDVFEEARQRQAAARAAEAPRYAAPDYERAVAAWEAALAQWRAENERFFLLRDYRATAEAARQAALLAERARERAGAVRDSLARVAAVEGGLLREQLVWLEGRLLQLPRDPAWRAAATRARAALARSNTAMERRDYREAAVQVGIARADLEPLGQAVQATLQAYLAQLPHWQRWAEETRRTTAGTPALVVDKMARRLYVYRAGQLMKTFPVELGPSWMGPKLHEGDHATPEGRYRIRRKLGAGETRYHRALEIDYPNAEDQSRFDDARRRGQLPRTARIGGLIEIHGAGGRGADWTQGCIALSNADMEALYALVPVGAPVTIVGSLTRPPFWSQEAATVRVGRSTSLAQKSFDTR